MHDKIIIKSQEILSKIFFPLKKVIYEESRDDGSKKEVWREVYHTLDGATILLYNTEQGTVVLTRQFRLPAFMNEDKNGSLIEACAGLVEEHENAEETIVREAEEETGYRVEDPQKLFELYSTPGSVTEKLSFFVAAYNSSHRVGSGGGLAHEHEDIEVLEMPFTEAFAKMESGEIRDAKTVILLQYAKMNIFQEEKVFDIL